MPVMGVAVERVDEVTDEVAQGLVRLLPQLSRSATRPDRTWLDTVAAHPAITLLLARIDGRIVGMLTLAVFPLLTGVRAWVEDVVVDESARGGGVGEALTRGAIRLAVDHGARTIDLTSRPEREAANRLYRRLGFEIRDSHVFRYQPDDQRAV
jgi:ribosomal protein S18 acetylase RimI-like enzyme